jgi:hypothetical protein
MTIAHAALHKRLRYRRDETGLYVAAFDDERMFFATRRPDLYDRQARLIEPREVRPGSYVNIKYAIERGLRMMQAVQVVTEPSPDSPFDPILDDGHL